MPVNLFARFPDGTKVFLSNAESLRQSAPKPSLFAGSQCRARAGSQPARISPRDVVLARYRMYKALLSMQNRQKAVVAQMQAVRLLLLAYAELRGVNPAAAASASARQSTTARPASAPPEGSGSGKASGRSYRSEYRSSRTHDSSSKPQPHAEPKTGTSSAKAGNTKQSGSTDEPKRANSEKPRQGTAQSKSLAAAFRELGLPVTATVAEATKAYRKAALIHHPDKGGDAEKFKVLSNAYQEVKRHLEKQNP